MIDLRRYFNSEIVRYDRVKVVWESINDAFLALFPAEEQFLDLIQDLVALGDLISLKPPQRQPLDVKILLSHHSFHHLKVPSMPHNLDNDWGRHFSNLKFAFSRLHQLSDLFFELQEFLDWLSLRFLADEHVKAWLLLEVRSLTPLVPSLAVEVLLERLDGLVLIKILLDLSGEVFWC